MRLTDVTAGASSGSAGVSTLAHVHGRARRSGIGWLHHRPLNFHADARRAARLVDRRAGPQHLDRGDDRGRLLVARRRARRLVTDRRYWGIGEATVPGPTRSSGRPRWRPVARILERCQPRPVATPSGHAAPGQRPVLVRQRAQVQALPQAHARAACCRGSSARCGRCRRTSPRPPYADTGERRRAGTSRASSRPRSSSGCESPASWPPRSSASPARRSARADHRRDRRLRPPAVHRARRLPVAAQLQRLPEERVHVGERGHLPRHPRFAAAAGRRHHQPRRHRLSRRRARRHERHVLRRRRRPGRAASSCGSPRRHLARHRGGQAGAPAQRHRPGDRGRTPRSTATA